MAVALDEFKKALDSLDEALKLFYKAADESAEKKAFRDSCIQRFEFCVELSWKVALKILGSRNSLHEVRLKSQG